MITFMAQGKPDYTAQMVLVAKLTNQHAKWAWLTKCSCEDGRCSRRQEARHVDQSPGRTSLGMLCLPKMFRQCEADVSVRQSETARLASDGQARHKYRVSYFLPMMGR
jgi:hypothetical protein